MGLIALVCAGLGFSFVGGAAQTPSTLKAGFIYVGPIGDAGWTKAHDDARLIAEQTFPWLETIFVESVPEGEEGAVIDRMINEEGVDVIFATSFGFMDGTLAKAAEYPDKFFFHATGFKRAPNMGTYMADFHQLYYLDGLMAGALTKTNKLGYVGAFPIPELKRHINAFTMGARMVNPNAEVNIRWIFDWFNPAAAKEAAEALIAEGVDGLAFTEDTATVLQVAQQNGIFGFSHYNPMFDFAPEATVSGQIVHWEAIYNDILSKIYTGIYTTENLADVDYWWLLQDKAVELGGRIGVPIEPAYADALKAKIVNHPQFGEISVYDLVLKLRDQAADPEVVFSPFTGPISDRKGNLRVPDGVRLGVHDLSTMEWAVEGVVGAWPGEPE